MCISDDIEELIELGEIDIAKDLVLNHWLDRLNDMPEYEKIYWHYIESTHAEWIEARILYFRIKHGIDLVRNANFWVNF